jgi:cytochrome c553
MPSNTRRRAWPAAVVSCCIVACALAWSVAAHAAPQSVPDLQAAQWASSCVTCHGAARPVPGSAIPPLAGRSAARIENQMKAYASGKRPGVLMQQIAKGYDPEVVRAIAQWYARLTVEKP